MSDVTHLATEEVRQIIEEAIRIRRLPQRWLTPAQIRQAAEVWVAGRNHISDSSRRLMEEHGIHVSNKMEYVSPSHLKEPLYSAVLALMVERSEWPVEAGTNIPKWKTTPTISYSFKLPAAHTPK